MINHIVRFVDIGPRLHVREWHPATPPTQPPFLLVHGLSSNARTWDGLAAHLAERGHLVIAVDQRGHGLSDKPVDGYDFETISADLKRLIDALGLEKPFIAGQSWGGNVALAFAATYPGVAHGYAFVDGGFLNLGARSADFDTIWSELAPPRFDGLTADALRSYLTTAHPTWSATGITGTLANFEALPDGTMRPWLSRVNHRSILHALWQQDPTTLYPRVEEKVQIFAADDGTSWSARKRTQIDAAEAGLAQVETFWFENTAHDIHVERPARLAELMLAGSSS
jgi:pimeloyl-ACP methyl ester carboxylesterase